MEFISARTSGWIMILGFVMLVLGAVAAPRGAYEGDVQDRMQVIDSQIGRWIVSKVFDALAVLLPAVGFVILAFHQGRTGSGSTLHPIAGAVFVLAASVGIIYVAQLAFNPLPLYDRTSPAPIALALFGLMAAGLLLFGVTFLQSDMPTWLRYLSVIGPGLVLLLVVLIRGSRPILSVGPEAGFGIGVVLYLIMLTVGITLVRQPL